VKITDRTERFGGCFHCVAPERAVHMKIDEPGRDIMSVEIDDLVYARLSSFVDSGDLSFLHDNFKPIANSIGKNQTRVGKDHVA
jgi:hypothetical protein